MKVGLKKDQDKLKPTLLLDDMNLAINEVLKVLKFGEEKYSAGNWLLVENGQERYRNAADRHRLKKGIDSESGLLHLAHEAVNVLMLLELELRENVEDDEFKEWLKEGINGNGFSLVSQNLILERNKEFDEKI